MRIAAISIVLFWMQIFIASHAGAQVSVSTTKCVLTKWDKKSEKWKEVWAGVVPREHQITRQPWSLIAWEGASMDISSKKWNNLKLHDGRTTIHLEKSNGRIQISIGHVDSSNVKNPVPTDAMAFASDDSKEIGVGAFQKKLQCKLL